MRSRITTKEDVDFAEWFGFLRVLVALQRKGKPGLAKLDNKFLQDLYDKGRSAESVSTDLALQFPWDEISAWLDSTVPNQAAPPAPPPVQKR